MDDFGYVDTINNIAKPQIPRAVFEKRYIPYLFDPDPKTFNLKWLEEVAKNIYLEVDVMNPDGTLAFTVPPLRPLYNTSKNSDINFLANKAALETGIHRAKGDAFLMKVLPGRIHKQDGRDPEHEARWRAILIECGYADRLLSTTDEVEALTEHQTGSGLVHDPDNDGW